MANAIQAGQIEIGVGAGVEMMSAKVSHQSFESMQPLTPMQGIDDSAPQINPDIFENAAATQCLTPMGVTSGLPVILGDCLQYQLSTENVAQRFGITRQEQDQMAVESNQKAAAAQKNGYFDEELVPVTVWADSL